MSLNAFISFMMVTRTTSAQGRRLLGLPVHREEGIDPYNDSNSTLCQDNLLTKNGFKEKEQSKKLPKNKFDFQSRIEIYFRQMLDLLILRFFQSSQLVDASKCDPSDLWIFPRVKLLFAKARNIRLRSLYFDTKPSIIDLFCNYCIVETFFRQLIALVFAST